MRPAATAAYYDAVLDNLGNASWQPIECNPYRPLFEATAELVPEGADVVELGCGTGRLAALLRDRVGSYLGLDFAPRRIEEARRYAEGMAFEVFDLRTGLIPDASVYVANEVLEHLEDDLGLLRSLPVGATVILSVPSFDTDDHVRHFPEFGSARARYRSVLRIDHEARIPHGDKGLFFQLLRGIR